MKDRQRSAHLWRLVARLTVGIALCGGGSVAGNHALAAGPESLRFQPPAGWRQVHQVIRDGLVIRHYVPPGQGGATWRDMVTVQVLRTARPPSLDDLYGRALSGYRTQCPDALGGGLQKGESNGYPTGFWVLGCPENTRTGQGETAFFKATLGDQAVYVLQRVWRTEPFEAGTAATIDDAERTKALAMLKEAEVCIKGSSDHPCR